MYSRDRKEKSHHVTPSRMGGSSQTTQLAREDHKQQKQEFGRGKINLKGVTVITAHAWRKESDVGK
ncbi:16877_t:CDS:1, partial [Dentiscutata heterogama]